MATIAIGMPVFAKNDDDDLKRFFELYKGYIHSIGIDPSAVASNPAGWEKAIGILRACLTGSAARWYDSNILGKRVKLRNIFLHAAHGDEAAFKALAVTNVWPDYAIEGNRDIWLNRAGMEFTNDPLNHNVVGGAAGVGVAIAGGAGNARRQLRFSNLFQENMPVRDFYDKVRKSAKLLGYGNDVLVNQFLSGLNDDCAIEAERIGAERDIEELVGLLERVEKRKAELRIGRERQENIQYQRDRQIIPEQLPPINVKPVYRPKPKPKPQYRDNWEFYVQNSYPDEGPNPFDEDRNDDKRKDVELNKAMRELFLNDHDDPMDTSNAIRGVPIELVQDKNGEIMLI
ncbi:hypothetical protein RclHR1_27140002 [Rhizophagus clarus]|uniref:Uncharacterized protein n=1 Tax=Rhizophagus clarus TaxID=94130 RepID=A0A2Z6RE76_9GLOM|nr:hypothetical protein RclHR1_27140002 [Rhizophagus clarus]